MFGFGGGLFVKYCYCYLFGMMIDVVEINLDVIVLCDVFRIFVDDVWFSVVCVDGVDYLEWVDVWIDVILYDVFVVDGMYGCCVGGMFFDVCCVCLSVFGVLVINFMDDDLVLL